MPLFIYIFIYNCFIKIYTLAAYILSFKNTKAKYFVTGRQNIFSQIQLQLKDNPYKKTIWIHCASLGEFEQAKPIIEYLYKEGKQFIALSFFSPSGYEVSKKYPFANAIFYLPLDTKKNAIQLLQIVRPSLIIFIKYEFWFHYLTQAKQLQIPILLACGVFRKNQPFFKWYNTLHLTMLRCFNQILVQNPNSKQLLNNIKFSNVVITGDTRFDRVLKIANEPFSNQIIENFIQQRDCIIAGSTWLNDELALQNFINKNNHVVAIIAPHHVDTESIEKTKKIFPTSVLYSSILQSPNQHYNSHILIIDTIGLLNKLYRYATICFIGGGFGKDGVHNVLEASVYGKPIVIGPVYEKYNEVVDLVRNNAIKVIENENVLELITTELFSNKDEQIKMGRLAYTYTIANAGAINKTIDAIKNFI
ncbi:MAG: 3-deoxy-D-manno-octulosonic acid transferase [Chitinophagaceae bacterium]